MTNYWFVTHDLPSYRQEPVKIGRGLKTATRDKVFKGIRNGDRIIYYAKKKSKHQWNTQEMRIYG